MTIEPTAKLNDFYDDTQVAIQLDALARAHFRLAARQREQARRLSNSAASHEKIAEGIRECLGNKESLLRCNDVDDRKSKFYSDRFFAAIVEEDDQDQMPLRQDYRTKPSDRLASDVDTTVQDFLDGVSRSDDHPF